MPPRIIILGAGPAGLGAAFKLAHKAQVTVLEQNDRVGGNAGSFELAGVKLDYGSHRLHPSCDPEILGDIQSFIGADLLDRPRHGRIRIQSRWIHFPLKPVDLALRLPPSFLAGVAADSLAKLVQPAFNRQRDASPVDQENFSSVMQKGLGKTITRDFYFPYSKKLWGVDPSELSAAQARRRVSAGSLTKMARRLLSAVPGVRSAMTGRFYYPRQGFGQISEAYYNAARDAGADIIFQARVKSIVCQPQNPAAVLVEQAGEVRRIEADQVWSTIPITTLARLLDPGPPEEILVEAGRIDYRAMLLIYMVLEQPQFTQYDAHYFPETGIPITRLSEPKNYSAAAAPPDCTVLCAELPCNPEEKHWAMDDQALGQLVQDALAQAGIPITAPVRQVQVKRLRYAYPVYLKGYETHFDRLDHWIGLQDGLLTFGRQGLFAHDNTHHALYMAYAAAECLDSNGTFNRQRWEQYRRIFDTHVVED